MAASAHAYGRQGHVGQLGRVGRRSTFRRPDGHGFDRRDEGHAAARQRLETIATLLDTAVRVPGTNIRFGADAVLNLVPGLGTVAAQALSAWIVIEARRLGVPPALLLRMVLNLGIDTIVSSVPVLGWVADLFFRANRRNVDLLRRHLDGAGPRRPFSG
jgi:Domain of unknown function (DUF4112)